MKKEILLGVDIGGTNTVFGLVDEEGILIERASFKTGEDPHIEIFVKKLAKQLKGLYEKYSDKYTLAGIGVGAANGNYYTGSIKLPPNIPWIDELNLVEALKEYFDIPIVLTNDANAMAYGEMIFGAAKGEKDIIVVTLGTGLGSGIIVDGEMVYGSEGTAGELGHVITIPDGRKCGCGRRGCLETYVSAIGIKRTLFELLAKYNGESGFNDVAYDELDSKMIYDAALDGNKIALEAFEYTGTLLGIALANACLITQPKVIVLCGGLAKAGELIFKPTRETFESNILETYKNKIKIVPSTLEDNSAAIIGAAALVRHELDNN
jgi:glucokinase